MSAVTACLDGLGGFVGTVDTFEELKKRFEGINFHIEGLREDGDPMP